MSVFEREISEFLPNFFNKLLKLQPACPLGHFQLWPFSLMISIFVYLWTLIEKNFRQGVKNWILRVQRNNLSETFFYGFCVFFFCRFCAKRFLLWARKLFGWFSKVVCIFLWKNHDVYFSKFEKPLFFLAHFFSDFDASFFGVLALPFRQR